jgi:hypothetical protein
MADELRFGGDGFVDVDALPDVDPELALEPDALASLHDALVSSPVPEPDAATWSGIFDDALADDADYDGLDDLVPAQDEAGPFDAGFADDDPGTDDDGFDDDGDDVVVAFDDDEDDDLDADVADDGAGVSGVAYAAYDDGGLDLAVDGDDAFDLAPVDDVEFDAGISDDELESPTHVDGLHDDPAGR